MSRCCKELSDFGGKFDGVLHDRQLEASLIDDPDNCGVNMTFLFREKDQSGQERRYGFGFKIMYCPFCGKPLTDIVPG